MKKFFWLLPLITACGFEAQGQGQGQTQSQSQTQGQGGSSSITNGGTNYNCSNGAVCGNNNNVGGNVGNGNTGGNSGNGNVTGNGNSSGIAYTNDAGVCVPGTCAGYGVACGLSADGCGGVMNCGTCTEDAGTGSISINSTDGGGWWGPCFNPTETYPTGVLKYPDCNTYCQSIGASCSTTCQAGNLGGPANVLVWCNGLDNTCGNLAQYPDYIYQCQPNTIQTAQCVEAAEIGINNSCATDEEEGVSDWWHGFPGATYGSAYITSCPGTTSGGSAVVPTTTAQCCCQ